MPRENLCVQVGNHHTLSYTCTTTVDHKDQIWVAAMKRHCPLHYLDTLFLLSYYYTCISIYRLQCFWFPITEMGWFFVILVIHSDTKTADIILSNTAKLKRSYTKFS